jgi:phthalate 4,5-cis-dihydrodiol dehydrogenase
LLGCERADIRLAVDGLVVYGDDGVTQMTLGKDLAQAGRMNVIDELYGAVVEGVAPIHTARWGMATLEVCLALLESSKKETEVVLHYQVPRGG